MVVLSVLSLMAYPYYWYYKTWRDLKQFARERPEAPKGPLDQFRDISPGLRTLGLLLPFVNFVTGYLMPHPSFVIAVFILGAAFSAAALYLALTLVKGAAQLHPDASSFPRRRPLLAAGMVMSAIIGLVFLAKLPAPFSLLSFSACLPLALVQHWLNAFWAANEPGDRLVRQAFSIKEVCVLIIGGLVFGLGLLGMIMER